MQLPKEFDRRLYEFEGVVERKKEKYIILYEWA